MDQEAYIFAEGCKKARMSFKTFMKKASERGICDMEIIILGATFWAKNKS